MASAASGTVHSRPVVGAALLLLALVLAPLAGPAPAGAATTSAEGPGREPVILVHGWYGHPELFWPTFESRLLDAGYAPDEVFVWSYDWQQSNRLTAFDFEAYLDGVLAATGAERADVVTHSMGALSTRWCLKFRTCDGKVDDWVSLGGPNHGTTSASVCPNMPSCQDMLPGSLLLFFLNWLDETPGTAAYSTWWSPCDGTIKPQSSTVLSGAVNTQTGCLLHGELTTDATVFAQVLATLQG